MAGFFCLVAKSVGKKELLPSVIFVYFLFETDKRNKTSFILSSRSQVRNVKETGKVWEFLPGKLKLLGKLFPDFRENPNKPAS